MGTMDESKGVADLLALLEKTVRAVKIYPPTNPHCLEFGKRLYDLFTATLADTGPLTLEVKGSSILFDGKPVYENAERRESLAFVLYKDGLREITFEPGLEERELRDIVQAFNRDFTLEYLDDDISTYLWDRDLPHVTFHMGEEFLNESLPEELQGAARAGEAEVGESVRRLLHVEPFVPSELREKLVGSGASLGDASATLRMRRPFLAPALLALSAEETALLGALQAQDERHVFYEEMLDVVFSIFTQTSAAEHLQSYLALFRSLLDSSFSGGSLRRAIQLMQRLNALTAGGSAVGPHLGRFLADLGAGDLLPTLGRALEAGTVEDAEALPELLALFPTSAIPGMMALLGTLSSMKWRKLVCQALASLGASDPQLLASGAQDRRWYVVRNVAYTLGMIGTRTAIPQLAHLLAHRDARVRKEALRSLGRVDDPEARRLLLTALQREDDTTRITALRAIPKTGDPRAAAELLRLAEARGFAERPLEERLEHARALGRVADDRTVPALEERLQRRGWLRSGRQREEQLLAVTALVTLRTDAAREALRRNLPALEGEAQRLAQGALRGEAAPPAARERQP